jgi:hypothetical protein
LGWLPSAGAAAAQCSTRTAAAADMPQESMLSCRLGGGG